MNGRELSAVLDHYLDVRRKSGVLSTQRAMRAITTVLPDCPLTGRALEDAIAARAIKRGHVISFDSTED